MVQETSHRILFPRAIGAAMLQLGFRVICKERIWLRIPECIERRFVESILGVNRNACEVNSGGLEVLCSRQDLTWSQAGY